MTEKYDRNRPQGPTTTEQQLLPQAPPATEAELRLDGIVHRRLTERSAGTEVERRAASTVARRDATAAAQQRAEDAFLGYPCPSAQAAEIVQNFARLCIAGRPAAIALAQAAVDARPEVRRIFEAATARVAEGMAISEALAVYGESLPPLLVPALRAWELHGQQDAGLTVLARELRRLGALEQRNTFLEMKWPMQRAEARLRRAAQAGSTSKARTTINSSRGGIANRSRATMRWNDLFVSLWRCGVPISEALEVSGESCGNGHYRDALCLAAKRTREGVPLSECLAETRLLPVGLIDRLHTGEISGRLDETLEEFARVMEGDAKELGGQHLFMRRILPVMLAIWAVVIFVYCSCFGGNPAVAAIGALIFLPVAFLVWEFVFKQTIRGGPDLGIGRREPAEPRGSSAKSLDGENGSGRLNPRLTKR